MSSYITLARELNAHFQKSGYNHGMFVPIKTIDGVFVEVMIEKKTYGGNGLRLIVTTEVLICPADNEEKDSEQAELYTSSKVGYDSEITPSMLETLFKDLPNLKFNKLKGRFMTGPVTDNAFSFLEEFNNVETGFQRCCVCLYKTETTTCCKHHVCYDCIGKIKPTKDKSDTCDVCCPLCKSQIAFHIK